MASKKLPHLLSKLSIGDLTLKNRVILAPLTRGRCGRKQIPNEHSVKYYTQRSGAGIVITEGTIVSKRAMGWAGAAGIFNQEQVDGWKKVTESVHNADGIIFCQLWHTGRVASSCYYGIQPVSASAIKAEGQVFDYDGTKVPYEKPHALELDEIPGVIEEYHNAAKNAKEAGFDGVEIHGANGYLLDQFLQSVSNQRNDKYGGSKENRFRLVAEVIDAVKDVFPSKRIGIRLSPNGAFNSMGSEDNFDAFSYYISELNKFDLAYLHMMDGLGFGWHNKCRRMRLADARKHFDGAIIGNVEYQMLTAEGAIRTGAADLIAFGRPFISNPDLPERFRNGWPLADPAPEDAYYRYPNYPDGDASVGYTDFPTYPEQQKELGNEVRCEKHIENPDV